MERMKSVAEISKNMEFVDCYFSKVWNGFNQSGQMAEEHFWDICRVLEDGGFLASDDAAISAISIGPFKIVSTMDIQKKDLLVYFLEIIVPVIFSNVSGLPFEQVYSLYLLPAANLLIGLANNCYAVKDLLQWEILMYIREKNRHDVYPTFHDIKNAVEFQGVEEWQMEEAIKKLGDFKNSLGDKHELIVRDYDGRFKCVI